MWGVRTDIFDSYGLSHYLVVVMRADMVASVIGGIGFIVRTRYLKRNQPAKI